MVRVFKMVVITLLLLGMVFSVFYFREVERFDFSTYDPNMILESAETLTSKELMGRAVGEPGNALTVDYIKKFLNSKDIDYIVNWVSQLTPIIDGTSSMSIGDREFGLYRDFEFYINGRASDIDFEGEIVFLGEMLYSVDPEILKDRIVVVRLNRLSDRIIDYLIENEAKGVLYYTYQKWFSTAIDREFMNRKFVDIDGKISSEIFQGRITKEMADVIYELAKDNQYDEYFRESSQTGSGETPDQIVGVVPDVSIDVNVDYELLELPNLIINFPGKNSDVANNFFSRFDGQGVGNEVVEYFPSAVNGAGSTATLLHLAEVLNNQNKMPEEDINIVLINASQVSDKTFEDSLNWLSDKYTGNKNILVEYVGFEGSKGVYIDWDYFNDQSVIIGNKLFNYSGDLGVKFNYTDLPITTFDGYLDYTQKDNPIVIVTGTHSGGMSRLNNSSDDTFNALSLESLDNGAKLLLGYTNKDLYRNYPLNFIDMTYIYVFVGIVILGLMIMYVRELYALTQGEILSKIYYSRAYSFLTVIYRYITSFGVAFILIGLILNIPSNFNLLKMGESTLTNFSTYNMIKGTYFSFISIYRVICNPSSEISQKIVVYVLKSIKLIGWGLFISLSMGIIKGILDSYSKKQATTLKTLTSIIVYSIPDVMIAIFSLLGIIYLSKIEWFSNLIGPTILRTTIMPIVALSIIPSIYISRLIFVAIEEEKQKEYVKFLYYQGIPRKQVYFRQFAKVSIMKVLQSMKSILMVIFSNLILVENIFSVPGIMFNIITYKNNPYIVIVFALIIGILFILISGLSQFILKIISPKKEVLS